jgi:hypothetical protein
MHQAHVRVKRLGNIEAVGGCVFGILAVVNADKYLIDLHVCKGLGNHYNNKQYVICFGNLTLSLYLENPLQRFTYLPDPSPFIFGVSTRCALNKCRFATKKVSGKTGNCKKHSVFAAKKFYAH